MEAIRIRNLRSFIDDNDSHNGYVEIKPITVFVGKNSCGKSTLLRTFPLLRQSIASNTTGPILWYGDYVDFGSFSQTLSNKSSNNKIYFDFKTQISKERQFYFFDEYSEYFNQNNNSKKKKNIDIELKLGVSENKSISLTDRITFNIEGNKIKLIFSKGSIKEIYLNDVKENINTSTLITLSNKGLLPRVIDRESDFRHFHNDGVIISHFDKTVNLIKNCFHRKTSLEKIKFGLLRIGICHKDEFVDKLKSTFNRQKSFIKDINSNTSFIENDVYPNFILSLTPDILNQVNTSITKAINNTKYIAPLRATAERYYRHQDLHVHEIDHTGSNLAIFLSRLNKTQLEKFHEWTSENFRFKVHAGDTSLHHEIKVHILDDDEEYNISDMGFGFSQILPIVASVWNETQDDNDPLASHKEVTFVIEQPELHLHPQFQNLLAKAFAKVVKLTRNSNSSIRILFETHSNVMIDALGEAISEGIIGKEMVNIVLFEKEGGITRTNVSSFSEDGYLLNWPIGFFSGR
ncbi:AAA family ATPase [Vibrio fluvialis]